MIFDQYTIFFSIALLATGLSLYTGFAVQRQKSKQGTFFFTAMLFFAAVWTCAVGLGMLARSEEIAFIWIIIRMVGVVFCPVAWFFLALQYTGRSDLITKRTIILSVLIPFLSLVILLTNSFHSLFFTGIDYIQAGIFLIDETWHLGHYFIVHAAYSYILILVGDYLILKDVFRMSRKFRVQSFTFILATIIPLAVNITYTLHLIPSLKVNYDPLGFVFSTLIFGWGIYFYKLFDLSPIARELLVDSMIDGMIVINQKNQIVDLNPAAERIFGLDHNVIGHNLATILSRNGLPHLNAFGRWEKEQIELQPGGRSSFYEVQYSSIFNKHQVMGKLITIRNITEQKRVEAKLQQIAITDALTGLANHRHFYELLDQELERATRNGQPFSLVMIDIDLFKQVNDTFGHLVGDQVLREIAVIGQRGLRAYDILCRYGGEEFALILPETLPDEACEIADRLRQEVAAHAFEIDQIEVHTTISLGISHFDPAHPVPPKVLVDRSDQSLYFSKQEGRNRVTCWD
jgi:diguanylate cyclase (GGDEF)-like protein/PAS domain S-box-containing protein